ncbi:MAG: transcriptional regulator [Deltaproteobacteria bacterium]|nr:transcriptional regulator [Deltaproteobacteria bacterium]
MREGQVILTPLPQADGKVKPRPALALREMPGYGDFLVCGLSTQMHLLVPDFDELITGRDEDFAGSGLLADSLIRLGFLAVLPKKLIMGSIGAVSPQRHRRLLKRLSGYLLERCK